MSMKTVTVKLFHSGYLEETPLIKIAAKKRR